MMGGKEERKGAKMKSNDARRNNAMKGENIMGERGKGEKKKDMAEGGNKKEMMYEVGRNRSQEG